MGEYIMDIVTLAASRKYTDRKIMESGAVGIKYEIVDSLPSSGKAQTIYFVKNNNSLINDYYDEYVWISSSSAFEKIGSTQISEAPVQSVNGKTGAVKLTARDVGAISQDNLQEATNEALVQAKESGEFNGADGKSAYQYAQDGGYTKTEEEFAKKLASGALIVTITDNNGTLSADKTYDEIWGAIFAGTSVVVYYDGMNLPLIVLAVDFMWFGATLCVNNEEGAGVSSIMIEITKNGEVNNISADILEAQEPLIGSIDDIKPSQVYAAVQAGRPVILNSGLIVYTAFSVSPLIVLSSVIFNNEIRCLSSDSDADTWIEDVIEIPTKIPTVLPNPKALTFTGAVTGTYDGSAPMTVKIPSAVTDDHINSLIDTKLGVIENGSY